MIEFLLGMIVGCILVGVVAFAYARSQSSQLRHDLAFFNARLRTLVRLSEAGFVEPKSVEAASVLNEIHTFVLNDEERATPVTAPSGDTERGAAHPDDEEVAPMLRRDTKVGGSEPRE